MVPISHIVLESRTRVLPGRPKGTQNRHPTCGFAAEEKT